MYLKKATDALRADGVVKKALHAIRRRGQRGRRDIVKECSYLTIAPIGTMEEARDIDVRKINWILPPIVPNSGGHLNALRFAYMLEQRGFLCSIVIADGRWFGPPESVKANIRRWYFPFEGEVYLSLEGAPASFATIATGWGTAYGARAFRRTRNHCYFVQDFEPWFYPAGSTFTFCEATYRFGFRGITAGAWLANKLADEYGMETQSVGFSYDRSVYRVTKRQLPGRRVLFYGRPSSDRRAFELGILSLVQVAKAHPDVEFILVGGDLDGFVIPFRHRCEGVLDFQELAALYNECDIALVLSMTNASLLPIELMACGVPVVSNRAPWTEWLLRDAVAELAAPTVQGIAAAVSRLLDDPLRRAQLREAGLAAAEATSWDEEGDRMASILRTME